MDEHTPSAAERVARLIERLDEVAGVVECTVCAHSGWEPCGITVAMPHPDREGVVVLPFICRNCGYVRQHSASHLERPNS